MTTATDRLALIISANGSQAITELGRVGAAAKKNLGDTEKSIDRLGSKMTTFGATAAAGGAVAASGLFSVAKASAQLVDATQAADVTFGKNLSASIEQFAGKAQDDLGLSRRSVTETLQLFATLGKDAGLDGRPLLQFSEDLVQVGVDVASLKGKTNEDVFAAIQSGLAGEIEPLRRLGISLDDTKKKAEAVKLGLRDEGDNSILKSYEKVLTTKSLIESSPLVLDAKGDFLRTIDTLPNKLKQFEASTENLKASLGEGLVPIFTQIADAGSTLVDVFEKLPDPLKEVLGSVAGLAAIGAIAGGSLSLIGGGLLKLTPGLRGVVDGFKGGEGAAGKFKGALSGVNPAVVGVTAALSAGIAIYAAYEARQAAAAQLAQQFTSALNESATATEASATLIAQANQAIDSNRAGGAFDAAGLSVNKVIAAVNSAPGAFDQFKGSVDGVFGSLENLDSFASNITDFVGVTDTVGNLRAEAEKLAPAARTIVTGLLDQLEAGALTDKQFQDIIETLTRVDNASTATGQAISRQAKSLLEVVPAAQRSADAMRLFKIATDSTAGVSAQQEALAGLVKLLPEAAASAGVTAGGVADLGNASGQAAPKVSDLATALQKVRDGADGGLSEYASALSATKSATDAVTSAQERYTAAQKKLADLTDPVKRQERIAESLDRVRSAEEALSDSLVRRRKTQEDLDALMKRSVVAGSVPLVAEITKAADQAVEQAQQQLDQARKNFGEGSAQDIAAQKVLESAKTGRGNVAGLLDAALAEEGSRRQQEINDLLEEQAKNERSIMEARKDLSKARSDVGEASAGVDPEALRAAQAEIDSAKVEVGIAVLEFAGKVQDGKVSIDEFSKYLDQQVALGIISPEAAETFKVTMKGVETQAGLAAAALGQVAGVAAAVAAAVRPGMPLDNAPLENRPGGATRSSGISPSGVYVPGSRGMVPAGARRADGGPVVAGQQYLVNENGQEFFTPQVSGYVVNAARSKQLTGGSGSRSGAPVNNYYDIKSVDPKQTAREITRKQRAKSFRTGLN